MSEDKSQAFAGAVQYIQKYKEQYSIDELRQKLLSAGYSENVISEAEKRAFTAVNKIDGVASYGPIMGNLSKGKKIGDFFIGFTGYYVLILIGFGLIGLGIAVFLYFHFRKKHIYIARGILTAFIISMILIIAAILFLLIVFGVF